MRIPIVVNKAGSHHGWITCCMLVVPYAKLANRRFNQYNHQW